MLTALSRFDRFCSTRELGFIADIQLFSFAGCRKGSFIAPHTPASFGGSIPPQYYPIPGSWKAFREDL
jgi:hypothetical protein